MIRTYARENVRKRCWIASVLFFLIYAVASWRILTTHDGHELLWYVGGVSVAFVLLMRYLTSWQSLKGKYVFPKGGGPGEYFPGNTYTRKKYLRGLEVEPIYTEPVSVKNLATFAKESEVMRLAIAISFSPDIYNLPLYIAHRHDGLNHIAAASALLREILVELAKEGFGYCEECAEDRLRDGLRGLGLALNSMSRIMESGTVLLD